MDEFHGRSPMDTKCWRPTSINMLLPLQSDTMLKTFDKARPVYINGHNIPSLKVFLGPLHLHQHHFPWLRSDISEIDIFSDPPHPVWLCTTGVLLPEYPHYCWCCINTSAWTLPALIYIVCMKYNVPDVKMTEENRDKYSRCKL